MMAPVLDNVKYWIRAGLQVKSHRNVSDTKARLSTGGECYTFAVSYCDCRGYTAPADANRDRREGGLRFSHIPQYVRPVSCAVCRWRFFRGLQRAQNGQWIRV